MKKNILAFLLLSISSTYAQQNSINKKLNDICTDALSQTANIPADRKLLLDNLATEMANKKYIMFTCKTNSRRTLLL